MLQEKGPSLLNLQELSNLEVEPLEVLVDTFESVQNRGLYTLTATPDYPGAPALLTKTSIVNDDASTACCCSSSGCLC
jgi:hypothetical protein